MYILIVFSRLEQQSSVSEEDFLCS